MNSLRRLFNYMFPRQVKDQRNSGVITMRCTNSMKIYKEKAPRLCTMQEAAAILTAMHSGQKIDIFDPQEGSWRVRPNNQWPDFSRYAYRIHRGPRKLYVYEYDDGTFSPAFLGFRPTHFTAETAKNPKLITLYEQGYDGEENEQSDSE